MAPRKTGSAALARALRDDLHDPAIRLISFDEGAAERYGDIRSSIRVSPADAIQLACAAEAGVNMFVTNDQKIIGKKVAGIDFIAGLDGKLV